MPRQARLDAPGTLHHVMARGIERRRIFFGEEDYEDFLRRLEKAVVAGGARVFAWSLLPNHFHLLVRSGQAGLPTVMRRLMTGYVVSFNLRHRRHGHLFQNRYKSVVCEEEVYAQELTRYIHLNPLRARRVKTMEALAAYPYSGHSAILGKAARPWQAVEEVLARFEGSQEPARRRYEEFVAAGATQGRRPDLVGGGLRRSVGAGGEVPRRQRRPRAEEEESAYDARVLGSPEFVRAVLREAGQEEREVLRRATRRTGLSELGQAAAQLAGIRVEELCSGARRPAVVAARRALARVAIGELGRPGAEVARYLGVATSTANRAVTDTPDPLADRLMQVFAAR